MHRDKGWKKAARVTDDCFAAVIRAFMSRANPRWARYAEATRDLWERELVRASHPDYLGAVSLSEIRPSLVQAYLDGMDGKPGKQQAAYRALKQLEKWAIVRDILPRQITIGVETEHPQGGHVPWSDEQVDVAERYAHPELRRVITLAANTGQRRSDLVRMGWTDIEILEGRAGINVTQKKTGRKVWVPITSTLAAAMETWERRPGPFLIRADGRLWEPGWITGQWKYDRNSNPDLLSHKEADLVIHGLRGTACVRLRRAGATALQIADMVGMSEGIVARYCRFAAQKDNAVAAIIHLERTIRERKNDRREETGS